MLAAHTAAVTTASERPTRCWRARVSSTTSSAWSPLQATGTWCSTLAGAQPLAYLHLAYLPLAYLPLAYLPLAYLHFANALPSHARTRALRNVAFTSAGERCDVRLCQRGFGFNPDQLAVGRKALLDHACIPALVRACPVPERCCFPLLNLRLFIRCGCYRPSTRQ